MSQPDIAPRPLRTALERAYDWGRDDAGGSPITASREVLRTMHVDRCLAEYDVARPAAVEPAGVEEVAALLHGTLPRCTCATPYSELEPPQRELWQEAARAVLARVGRGEAVPVAWAVQGCDGHYTFVTGVREVAEARVKDLDALPHAGYAPYRVVPLYTSPPAATRGEGSK